MRRAIFLFGGLSALLIGCGGGGSPEPAPRTATVSVSFPSTSLSDAAPTLTVPGFPRTLGRLRKVSVTIETTVECQVSATAIGGASVSGDYSIRGFSTLARASDGLTLADTPRTAGGQGGILTLGPGGSQLWSFLGPESIQTTQTSEHTDGRAFSAFDGVDEVTMRATPKVTVSLPPGATSTTVGSAAGTVSVTYTYTPALP